MDIPETALLAMNDPFDPIAIDEAFQEGFRALGEVVYYFQMLEDNLGRAVSFLIDPDFGDISDIVVCEQSFKQLVALGYSIFEKYPESKEGANMETWKGILGRATNAEGIRNAVLHSVFGVSMVEQPVFQRMKTTAKYKKGFKESGEALDRETVEKTIQTISGVGVEICDFMGRVFPRWNDRTWSRERS